MKKTLKQDGYIVILSTLLSIGIISVIIVAISNIIVTRYSSSTGYVHSKRAYITAHSALEESLYRLRNGWSTPNTDSISLPSGSATIDIEDVPDGKSITVHGLSDGYERNLKTNLRLGTGISFHYGIQSGRGGFYMYNTSSVVGNVYSSGPIVGTGNHVYGDIISAKSTGLIDGIIATGTLYAHTINNSSAGKDAYYQNISNTNVFGTKYPGSTDQPEVDLPISDAQIAEWENLASTGIEKQCTNGVYEIKSNETIGPNKIPCDLVIKGSSITVTIDGHVWVVGDITTQNSPTIKISPSLGNKNVAIIADKASASTTSGRIILGQNTSFEGSGSSGSYVFMVSQNGSAENGGSVNAIDVGQSSSALIGYARHGLISLGQSVNLREATAYKIELKNSANITYDTGLPSTLFEAGPGGNYNVIDWLEI